MKITKLNAFALPDATVLRIETDSGLRGYGECRRLVTRDVTLLRQVATGADPSAYEVLRAKLTDSPNAQADLNMAMLDVLGKQAKAPIHSLLGGATRHKVRLLTPLTNFAAQIRAGERAFIVPLTVTKDSRFRRYGIYGASYWDSRSTSYSAAPSTLMECAVTTMSALTLPTRCAP